MSATQTPKTPQFNQLGMVHTINSLSLEEKTELGKQMFECLSNENNNEKLLGLLNIDIKLDPNYAVRDEFMKLLTSLYEDISSGVINESTKDFYKSSLDKCLENDNVELFEEVAVSGLFNHYSVVEVYKNANEMNANNIMDHMIQTNIITSLLCEKADEIIRQEKLNDEKMARLYRKRLFNSEIIKKADSMQNLNIPVTGSTQKIPISTQHTKVKLVLTGDQLDMVDIIKYATSKMCEGKDIKMEMGVDK